MGEWRAGGNAVARDTSTRSVQVTQWCATGYATLSWHATWYGHTASMRFMRYDSVPVQQGPWLRHAVGLTVATCFLLQQKQ